MPRHPPLGDDPGAPRSCVYFAKNRPLACAELAVVARRRPHRTRRRLPGGRLKAQKRQTRLHFAVRWNARRTSWQAAMAPARPLTAHIDTNGATAARMGYFIVHESA